MSNNPENRLEIRKAAWGAGQTWVDVTAIVRGMVARGESSIPASVYVFGDPLIGSIKTLRIEFIGGGRQGFATAQEGSVLQFPVLAGAKVTKPDPELGKGRPKHPPEKPEVPEVAQLFGGKKPPDGFRWRSTGKVLGKGGQAEVVEVEDKQNPTAGRFALKTLVPRKQGQALQRFKTEIGAIKSLSHPNILGILDYSDNADFPYYVMELVEGAVSLREAIENESCPYKGDALKAVDFFLQIAEAIKACETVKVVHRDLSPGNILIAPDTSIRVIDFGVCQMEGAKPITLDGESVGTHDYMAPECESWAEGEATNQTDLYSAGKLLWSAITGLTTFSHEELVFTTRSMSKMFPDRPETFHLHSLFEKTTRRLPADRFANATDAIQEAKKVRKLILGGYPPLELLAEWICPICGVGKQGQTGDPYGNSSVALFWYQCDYCGYVLTRSRADRARTNLERRKTLN